MTTNVPKGAGRPAAAARSAKHAQRTPLPPKAGSPGAEAILEAKIDAWGKTSGLPPEAIEAMKETLRTDANIKTVEQALAAWEDLGDGSGEKPMGARTIPTTERHGLIDPAKFMATSTPAEIAAKNAAIGASMEDRKPMGERTVAELRKMASGLGIAGARDMRKGDLLNAILLAERAKAKISASKTPEEFAAQVFKVAEKSVEPKPTPPKPRTPVAVCDRPALSEPQAKSMAKAEAFLEAAAAVGWAEKTRSEPGQDPYGVIVGRGEERIMISWSAGVFVGEECYHSHPGRSPRKVINASAAKKIMAIPAAAADEEARKVSAHKAARPRKEATTERRKALPFDPETASDEEVLTAVSGGNKRISWTNEVSGAIEDAYVTGKASMQPGKSGRSLRFTSATGFRSVRVSSLLSVR